MNGFLLIASTALVTILLPLRAWQRRKRKLSPLRWQCIFEAWVLTVIVVVGARRYGILPAQLGLFLPSSSAAFVGHTILSLSVILLPDALLVVITRRCSGVTLPSRKEIGPLIALFLSAAAWEELCFRGLPFAVASPDLISLILTAGIASIAFAAQHMRGGPRAVGASFIFGVAFSVLYLVTSDLPAVILAHALSNFIVFIRGRPMEGMRESGNNVAIWREDVANLV